MKKVILVSLPSSAHFDILNREEIPPLALYVLAPAVRQNALEPIVFDPNVFANQSAYNINQYFVNLINNYLDDILAFGFSANSFNWALTLKLVRFIKNKYPHIPIILGGLHPTRFPDYTLKVSGADYVLIGEGEISMQQLLAAIKNNNFVYEIKGLVSAKKILNNNYNYSLLPLEEFELLPNPAFDLLPNNSYDAMPLESSRGCLHSCAFCSIPHRKNWRGRSAESLLSRVQYAKKFIYKFKQKNVINFTDDCFTQDVDRAKEVLNKLLNLHDGFKYFIEARVSNLLKDNLIEEIPIDVVSSMQIGVECGYDEGLKLVKKGIKIQKVYECLEKLNKVGLNKKAFVSFIIGFPWEGEEEINKTIDTVYDLVKKYNVRCIVNWLIFLPSDLWQDRQKYFINIDESLYDEFEWNNSRENFFKTHPKISEELLKKISKKLFVLQAENELIEYHYPLFYNKKVDKDFNDN